MAILQVVLGDQLDPTPLDDLDPERDALWMAELDEEATHVWCHKQRLLMFFSAMRHFRDARRAEGWEVRYKELPPQRTGGEHKTFRDALASELKHSKPERVRVVEPGDLRVLEHIEAAAEEAEVELEILPDPHFLLPRDAMGEWLHGRKVIVLAHFYKMMRKRIGVFLDADGNPEGGDWSYDADNRESFGKSGPPDIPKLPGHEWDETTREVAKLVEARYADHPGSLEAFDLPVTPQEAERMADAFIEAYLPRFGPHQDAMWPGRWVLWHSRLSAPMNLKLIHPRTLIDRAEAAYRAGKAPLASVEGFIRQVLGWRELVRGIYQFEMPGYARRNALRCDVRPVPSFFWDGETDMACVADSMKGLLELGYVHHIHRLMVLGQFSMLLGVHPYQFHEWHMAMYLDAIDWVSLPNALGMSQYGDGGILGTKPYAATGKYIDRMSPYCKSCKYKPGAATGDEACPFTTLYWDFLARHRRQLEGNRRMALQVKNLDRRSDLSEIRSQAEALRARIDADERI